METWRGEVYRQWTALKMTYEVVKCFCVLACTVTRDSSVENVKLTLCMPCRFTGREGSMSQPILGLGSRWRWASKVTLRLLYLQGKSYRYPLNMRLDLDVSENRKLLAPAMNRPPARPTHKAPYRLYYADFPLFIVSCATDSFRVMKAISGFEFKFPPRCKWDLRSSELLRQPWFVFNYRRFG
jgi:hypothetical protein